MFKVERCNRNVFLLKQEKTDTVGSVIKKTEILGEVLFLIEFLCLLISSLSSLTGELSHQLPVSEVKGGEGSRCVNKKSFKQMQSKTK
jgi:hypothetical protein